MKLQVGDRVWSDFFGQSLQIVTINSDDHWYFRLNDGRVMRAQTPLSHFENKAKIDGEERQPIKQLPKDTVCVLFEIQKPIWNGGKRCVGLNLKRIRKHNEIRIAYKRKSDGQLTYPDNYYFSGDNVKGLDYEIQNVHGVSLVIVPIEHLEILERV